MKNRVVAAAVRRLAERGYVVSRHPAVRRQRLLAAHGVGVVLDVGAARGEYGAELRRFGYTGTIVSVEPLPAAFARLREARGSDPRWQVEHCALGDVAGPATLHVASNSDSSSLLAPHLRHRTAAPHVSFTQRETVQVRRLDEVAAPHLRPADRVLLKLDTQGFERQVLAGGAATLDRCVGVQLELSFTTLYDGGMLADEAVSALYGAGFELVGVTPGFTEPSGAMLQADGLFWRPVPAVAP